MTEKLLTCVECPRGCQITVTLDDGKVVSVVGNFCPRGKVYAENECVNPKRVVTSTMNSDIGVLVPVRTDKPVLKANIFDVMKKINATTCKTPIKLGDVIIANIDGDANLIASKTVK
ncbi:MAG: DUF1667 domain-containing protein [Clostridia bacterium]|nr:DUF1667 domain-containing protein [Clostridia bacterium]